MNTALRLAVSVFAVILATGSAFADPDGFIAGGVGANSFGYNGEFISGSSVAEVRGSLTGYLTPSLSAQGDVVFQYQDTDPTDYSNFSGTLHLSYREPEQFLAGAFVQLGANSAPYNSARLFAGVEGQVYLGDLTLYGQAGAMRVDYDSDFDYSGLFATAELRYFLTPDFKIDIHGVAMSVQDDLDYDYRSTALGMGVGAEYKLTDSPISVYGALDHFGSGPADKSPYTDTRVTVGVKFNFGTDSLKDQDRNGTTLKPVAQPPFYSDT